MPPKNSESSPSCLALVAALSCSAGLAVTVRADEAHAPEMSPQAQPVPLPDDPAALNDELDGLFRPDPTYGEKPYDPQAQLDIYGAKRSVTTARPLLELGRELYGAGPFQPGHNLAGRRNLFFPWLLVYGDWRTAVAYNDNGEKEQGRLATRLNLEIDLKLTATERVHAFMRPLDKDNNFTRIDFSGEEDSESTLELDGNLDALFFEGDAGAILRGITDTEMDFDLPFSFGLMPLLFQNGVWVEDAFTGLAFSIPARNSALFDISNFDVTFFAGFDRVTTAATGNDDDANVYGVTAFIEKGGGYWELGYGYLDDNSDAGDQSYHNLTAAFTRRYGNLFSNSVRVIYNTGQERDEGRRQTADGVLLLVENSLITSKPSTLVPYVNFFAGFDRPQSLARDAGAGGVLKNTGILFETDGLTGFPKMDDTANNTYGAALGVNYLFDLDQQIVLEAAILQPMNEDENRVATDAEYGVGFRYQLPLNNAMILRLDGIYAWREEAEDLAGVRCEFRWKF
jgi:hypothetical protein